MTDPQRKEENQAGERNLQFCKESEYRIIAKESLQSGQNVMI